MTLNCHQDTARDFKLDRTGRTRLPCSALPIQIFCRGREGGGRDLHLGDLAGLVVASEDGNAVLVADLEGDEERDGLDGVVAAIDVVA